MLINDEDALIDNTGGIFSVIAGIRGHSTGYRKIDDGIYEIHHFGSSHWPVGYENYPVLENDFGCYGVCDDYKQILEQCPEITNSSRKFIITVTPIVRADEPAEGGWRWRKWGEYIGTHKPQYEYLHDEKDIERVFVYHVYEKV